MAFSQNRFPPGGGGGTSICMHILGMCRVRDPHFHVLMSSKYKGLKIGLGLTDNRPFFEVG